MNSASCFLDSRKSMLSFCSIEEKKPIVTLGQAYEAGWRVNARCSHGKKRDMKQMPECLEQAELDMETLVWTRGEGFLLQDL